MQKPWECGREGGEDVDSRHFLQKLTLCGEKHYSRVLRELLLFHKNIRSWERESKRDFQPSPNACERLGLDGAISLRGRGTEASPETLCVCKVGAFLSGYFSQEQVTGRFSQMKAYLLWFSPHNYCHLLTTASPSVPRNASTYLTCCFTRKCVCVCDCVCGMCGWGEGCQLRKGCMCVVPCVYVCVCGVCVSRCQGAGDRQRLGKVLLWDQAV